MKPVDPRLVRTVRIASTHLVWCVVLGALGAVFVVAQAELIARGITDVAAGRSVV